MKSAGRDSFFLWGLRQTGKSSLLKQSFPNCFRIDLLKASERLPLQSRPELLREILRAESLLDSNNKDRGPIIIDEVQKVPALLDEVHSIIEEDRVQFALCGSSARKLKRGHANLLGGRALRFELHGLSAREIGPEWSLKRMLNHGFLPRMYDHSNPKSAWRAYIQDYIKEEILEEGLVRSLPPFSRFLELASLSDTEVVSWQSFARDVGVSAEGVKGYFDVLCDTNVGSFLPAYQARPKRRTRFHPKFYFSDVGLVNQLAHRGDIEPGGELFGKAFENWVYHELKCYQNYCNPDLELSYWALTTGVEVDFICSSGPLLNAFEAKSSSRIQTDHLKGMRQFIEEYPEVSHRVIVSLENRRRTTEDGIQIVPAQDFVNFLWSGEWGF